MQLNIFCNFCVKLLIFPVIPEKKYGKNKTYSLFIKNYKKTTSQNISLNVDDNAHFSEFVQIGSHFISLFHPNNQ